MLCLLSLGVFAVIRIRNAPERKAAGVAVLRLAHRRGVADPVHDLQRAVDAVLLPRPRPRRWARSPTRPGRGRRSGSATCSPACRRARWRCVESVGLLLHIGVMLAFLIIVAYSKHLHIFVAPINVSAKRLPKALGPLPVMTSGGKPIDFEDPRRGRRVRPREDRGLHLEGHAGLRHLHRVRPLPVAVPGVEHRQAAVAQAGDHGPAGPPDRQGARTSIGGKEIARRGRRSTSRRRPAAVAHARRAGVGLRAGARVRARAGGPAAGRARPSRAG